MVKCISTAHEMGGIYLSNIALHRRLSCKQCLCPWTVSSHFSSERDTGQCCPDRKWQVAILFAFNRARESFTKTCPQNKDNERAWRNHAINTITGFPSAGGDPDKLITRAKSRT